MQNLFFYIGLSCILIHEMDAITCKEWRIFPLLSQLDDKMGYFIFTGLHFPLSGLLFWGLYFGNESNQRLMQGLDIFFVIHIFLHWLLRNHPKNLFKTSFSWAWIIGAGLFGVLDFWAKQ